MSGKLFMLPEPVSERLDVPGLVDKFCNPAGQPLQVAAKECNGCGAPLPPFATCCSYCLRIAR